MEKKVRIYLDTSVISHLYADDAPEHRECTRKFWSILASGHHIPVISDVVLIEIGRCGADLRNRLLSRLEEILYENVPITEEIDNLAGRYCTEGIIPRKYFDDALHIASATLYGCDVIVSWNFSHIVKLSTVRGVKGINLMLGYREVEILTPDSFLEGGEEI